MSNESLLVMVAVGQAEGRFADQFMPGDNGHVGDWLLPRIGVMPGTGTVVATIGDLLLLLILRLVPARRAVTALGLASATVEEMCAHFQSTRRGVNFAVNASCDARRTIKLVEALANLGPSLRENTRCAC